MDGGVTLSKKQFAELISMSQKFPLKENLKVRKKWGFREYSMRAQKKSGHKTKLSDNWEGNSTGV